MKVKPTNLEEDLGKLMRADSPEFLEYITKEKKRAEDEAKLSGE